MKISGRPDSKEPQAVCLGLLFSDMLAILEIEGKESR